MITVIASPTLPAANMLTPVTEGAVTANTSTIISSGTNPTGVFSDTLTSQLNLIVKPTTDIAALATTVPPTILSAIVAATTQNATPAANSTATATIIPTQILPDTAASNLQNVVVSATTSSTVVEPDVVMSATDTAILSSVKDTLQFISTGSKLGDTLSTEKTVQLPTVQPTALSTTQTAQVAVPQPANVNSQVTTPAAVLAQQVTPVQVPTTETPVVAAEIETPAQVSTPETPVVAAEIETPAQVSTPETPVVAAEIETPAQVLTPETPVVAAEIETPAQVSTPETPVVAAAQVSAENIPPQIESLVTQQVIPAKVEKKVDIKDGKAVENAPVSSTLTVVAESAALVVSQSAVTTEKPKQTASKSDEHELPVITPQAKPEITAPLVAAQAAPAQIDTQTEVLKSVNPDITSNEKTHLTPAKNLLMAAIANRNNTSNTNGNSANSDNAGNSQPNPTLQTELSANPVIDTKTNLLDAKSFTSLLSAEKSDLMSGGSSPTTDKLSAPQNMSAAVSKLVQDTKFGADVPAMTKPLSHPEWNQDMGERIVWMNSKGISSAEIKMNPQNMGPITVRIDMTNQDQATIAFTAQNNDVRQALEASIPKLREMLNSQNLNLTEVNVSQQSSTSTNSDSNRSQQHAAQVMADASTTGQNNQKNNPELEPNNNANAQTTANDELYDDVGTPLHENVVATSDGLISIFA